MKNIKAIIFDLDNTIVDRTSTFRNFTNTLLKKYFNHLQNTLQNTQPLFERIIHLDQDGYKDKKALFTELIEKLPWKEKPQLKELLNFYNTEYVKNAILFDQAMEIIQYSRTKYKTGIITNGRNMIQYGKIDHLGIRKYFDMIIVSEEAGYKKPDPRIFELALEKLQLRAEQCLFIGDHPINDIEGASKIGMKTIWLQVNQPWEDGLVASPLYTIDQLGELLEII